jgi:2,3-bisphosphoglycerate-dependent phosphoglycerate mutase
MKRIYFLSALLCLLCLGLDVQAQEELPTRTFVLLRHAEKENSVSADPALTLQGQLQATALASLLRDQPIDAVYSTTYRRTRDTVAPLAEQKGVNIQYYDPVQASEMLQQLMLKPDKGAIVVVGHSNTIPDLVNTLLGREAVAPLSEEEYGLVFIVTLKGGDESGSLLTLRLPDAEQTKAK